MPDAGVGHRSHRVSAGVVVADVLEISDHEHPRTVFHNGVRWWRKRQGELDRSYRVVVIDFVVRALCYLDSENPPAPPNAEHDHHVCRFIVTAEGCGVHDAGIAPVFLYVGSSESNEMRSALMPDFSLTRAAASSTCGLNGTRAPQATSTHSGADNGAIPASRITAVSSHTPGRHGTGV